MPIATSAQNQIMKWKASSFVLATISVVMWGTIVVFCLQNSFWNSRTVHMEEYHSGSRPIHPQSYWGLVWGVSSEWGSNVESVAASTCFERVGECSTCDSGVVYKDKANLCGPNLWHMSASCSIDDSSKPLLAEYMNTLDMAQPTDTQFKKWMHGDYAATDSSAEPSRWHGELCRLSKIKPIVSFATDSHSYSFLVSGNVHVYMYTVFAILTYAFLSDFANLSSNAAVRSILLVFFFLVYVFFFVLWNRNFNMSILKETVYEVVKGVWSRNAACDSKKQQCETVWTTGDSCTASILLTWTVFSYYAWLMWSSDYSSYKKKSESDAVEASMVNGNTQQTYTTPQFLPHSASHEEITEAEKKNAFANHGNPHLPRASSMTLPPRAPSMPLPRAQTMTYAPLWSIEDQMPLLFKTDVNVRNVVTATAETNSMPELDYVNIGDVSQSSQLVACTILFVFPLWVAGALSSRKFSLDTFIQSRLIVAVIFGGLQYVFMSLSWISGVLQNKGNKAEQTTKCVKKALQLLRKASAVMQLLLILLQLLIILSYFTLQWPSGYSGMHVVSWGGLVVVLFNLVQVTFVYWHSRMKSNATNFELSMKWLVYLHRLLLVLILLLSAVMYYAEYQNSILVSKDFSDKMPGESMVIHDYWVYGANPSLHDSRTFTYAMPASYL